MFLQTKGHPDCFLFSRTVCVSEPKYEWDWCNITVPCGCKVYYSLLLIFQIVTMGWNDNCSQVTCKDENNEERECVGTCGRHCCICGDSNCPSCPSDCRETCKLGRYNVTTTTLQSTFNINHFLQIHHRMRVNML